MDKPTVFISYSRKDTEFVRQLAGDLEQAGYDPWWDVADLRGGQAWAVEIEKQVRACAAMVVVLSPDATGSEWVGKETLLALDLKKPLIPLMWRESKLPLSLVDRQFVDFRGPYDDALQALFRALPSSPEPTQRAAQDSSAARAAAPSPSQRQVRRRIYAISVVVVAVVLVLALAWIFRAPLIGFLGAAPSLPTSVPSDMTMTARPAPTLLAAATAPLASGSPTAVLPAGPTAAGLAVVSSTATLDYSAVLPPVRDQKAEASNVGFAVAAAMEYQIWQALGKQVVISPRYLYYYARLKGGLSTLKDSGAYVRTGVEALKETGAVPEDAWPYKAGEFAMEPPPEVTGAVHYRITESIPVRNAAEIKQALKQYGPVVARLPVFEDVYDVSVSSTGILWMPDSAQSRYGALAFCFVGYDDAQRLLKFKGSWGQGWGDRGYGYVSYAYVDEYVEDAWALSGLAGTRINPQDGAAYVLIPPGEFLMGSAADDPSAMPGEKPRHTFSVDAFWLMQTEVTNAQYARCVEAGACSAPAGEAWKDGANASHPVAAVTWPQANAYAGWLGGRLPTEAEWEKACRGTDGRQYPWGNDPVTAQRLNCSCVGGAASRQTTPVRNYPAGAGPYGALDMAGNVWEWTASLWGQAPARPDYAYPYDPRDGRENLAAPDSILRVLRGGSFTDHSAQSVRCATRIGGAPQDRQAYVGFRVALSP